MPTNISELITRKFVISKRLNWMKIVNNCYYVKFITAYFKLYNSLGKGQGQMNKIRSLSFTSKPVIFFIILVHNFKYFSRSTRQHPHQIRNSMLITDSYQTVDTVV